jgi:hypothetical protein
MLCSRFGSLEMCMRKFETAFFSSSWNSMKVKQRYCCILDPRALRFNHSGVLRATHFNFFLQL